MKVRIFPGKWQGIVQVPASKSDAQRAILAAALAHGESTLSGVGNSDDEQFMLSCIQQLGAQIAFSPDYLVITGIAKMEQDTVLPPGESGLGLRLLSAVGATFEHGVTLQAKGSAIHRPMDFYADVLPLLNVEYTAGKAGFPIQLKGPMTGRDLVVDGSLSSQFVSGLLMAFPIANGNSSLIVQQKRSGAYIEMTLATLAKFGIQIDRLNDSHFQVKGNQLYQSTDYKVESDWSAASYWLVASALGQEVYLQGLSSNSLQADRAICEAFKAANCVMIETEMGLRVDGIKRTAFEFDATDCPDLFPALVTLAASISGVSVITGTDRLLHKESNRALTLQSEFGKLGVQILLDSTKMVICGTGSVSGGRVQAHNDHRIAMCLAIAASIAKEPVIIDDAGAVSKSYPDFWEHLLSVAVHQQDVQITAY